MRRLILTILFLISLAIERRWQIPLTWILLIILYWRHTHRGLYLVIATLIVDLTLIFPLGSSAVAVAIGSLLLDYTPIRFWARLIWYQCLFGLLVGGYAMTVGTVNWQMMVVGIIAGIGCTVWKLEPDSVEIGNA